MDPELSHWLFKESLRSPPPKHARTCENGHRYTTPACNVCHFRRQITGKLCPADLSKRHRDTEKENDSS